MAGLQNLDESVIEQNLDELVIQNNGNRIDRLSQFQSKLIVGSASNSAGSFVQLITFFCGYRIMIR